MCKRNVTNLQKQPPRGVPRERCSENMQQIYGKTPMPKSDFNKVAKKQLKGKESFELQEWFNQFVQ